MKKVTIAVLILVVLASLWVFSVQEEKQNTTSDQQTSFSSPTERFTGKINGEDVVFEQKEYTKYRLEINGKVSTGSLNTERGFGSDIDATVYILNWDKPEAEQKYYVRLTSDQKHIQLLDSNRKVVPGALLAKEDRTLNQ